MRIVNLLPQQEQELIKQERVYLVLRRIALYSLGLYLFGFMVLIGSRIFLAQSLTNLDNEIAKLQAIIGKESNTKLRDTINFNNAVITDYNNLVKNNPNWSKISEQFAQLVPPGVSVKEFSGNTGTGKIEISGSALTRGGVLELRANILNSDVFQNIDLPLDNLQQPTNLNYHYSFYIKPGLLRSQAR